MVSSRHAQPHKLLYCFGMAWKLESEKLRQLIILVANMQWWIVGSPVSFFPHTYTYIHIVDDVLVLWLAELHCSVAALLHCRHSVLHTYRLLCHQHHHHHLHPHTSLYHQGEWRLEGAKNKILSHASEVAQQSPHHHQQRQPSPLHI